MNININYSDNLLNGSRTLGKSDIKHKKKCLDQNVLKFWNKSKSNSISFLIFSRQETSSYRIYNRFVLKWTTCSLNFLLVLEDSEKYN